MKDQIARSAVSIPSNIAEGAERDSDRDFIRFLRISKASSAECSTQLKIAWLTGQISEETFKELDAQAERLARQISCLIRSLNQQAK